MIYVDPLMSHGWVLRGRHVQSCHMFTDGAHEGLHRMAERIGLRRSWAQERPVLHYDLTESRRAAAVAAGAVVVDRRGAVRIWRSLGWKKGVDTLCDCMLH